MTELDSVLLSTGHKVYVGRLPVELLTLGNSNEHFTQLWQEHPEVSTIRGGQVIKRWQQAYGRNYRFSGAVAEARPITATLSPYLSWAQQHLDGRLNGLLLNWYDGALKHYISPHRDDDKQLVPGAPIVTISLGEERVFRLTLQQDGKQVDRRDLSATCGTVIVIPWDTNKTWKHSVPPSVRYQGRRISITLRAFAD